ncbi:MAG: phosphatidate cytidylyltransferase [Betaproteobacteria bacterium]|nr:phosphatidate cytidylyltransferase [Betaproteobacteria bacterium]
MLRLRILSACALGALLLAILLFLPPLGWTLFVIVVIAVAAWEWAGFAKYAVPARLSYLVAMVLLTLSVLAWAGVFQETPVRDRFSAVFWIASLFWMLGVPYWIWRMPMNPSGWLVLAIGMVVLLATALAIVDLRTAGVGVMLAIMAIVWVADVAAYFVGRAIGKHKLAPRVSPGKTVEGAIGALIGVAIYAIAATLAFDLISATLAATLAVAIGLACFGILGDLFESALKRQAGIKDSGNVLPGHGGILDRIDALLPVLPMAALLLPR